MRAGLVILVFAVALIFFSFVRLWLFYSFSVYQPKIVELPYQFEKKELIPQLTPKVKFAAGKIGLDFAHENDVSTEELAALLVKLLEANKSIEFIQTDLVQALQNITSLIIISPKKTFSKEEIEEIKKFKAKGNLLLAADPGQSEINSLATSLGLFFEPGYVYNLNEFEGVFKNIYIKNFSNSSLVSGLSKLLLREACTIKPYELGIAFVDNNTFSSEKLIWEAGAVAVEKGNVAAICDTSWFKPRWLEYADNAAFLSAIVNWLK